MMEAEHITQISISESLVPGDLRRRFRNRPTLRFWICFLGCFFSSPLTSLASADRATAPQWAPSRMYHVANYRLSLRFNEQKDEVFGDEVITLRPLGSNFRRFYLDSSELKIDSVRLERADAQAPTLGYTLQGPRLWITLDRNYDEASTLKIHLIYRAFPRTGLYFVNPTRDYPNAPREVYSQGEPELNHFWFPCWDYPNDMATSETITTVPQGQIVVSNGTLVSVKHSAGQLTYDWVERIPHSSYLISIAIGPWHRISDIYHGKEVDYYVPRSIDETTARRSFHLTPDMIGFFSRATGVDYPYEKYAQTTVHDYPFGGEENVSATTLTENTLHDERADQDYPSTSLVSHELGQQWCGDYVQGRDWANIWLNEGCATFLDALYTQYHVGNDEYRFEIYNDQLMEQAEQRENHRRAIVDRHYTDPMQMFDSITHEKGAAVFDMLRFVLDGSEAASHPASPQEPLLRALHDYLIAHSAQSVDTDQLLESVQSATGQELGWFFHEWVYMAGHPDYRVEASYNSNAKVERIMVAQTQHIDSETPVFDMPIDVIFYGSAGQRQEARIRDNVEEQEFTIPLEFRPLWVDFDPYNSIDKTLHFEQPFQAMVVAAQYDPSMMSRLWAVQQLGAIRDTDSETRVDALTRVLSRDRFYGVRAAAATCLGSIGDSRAESVLLSALHQSDGRVRVAVVSALGFYRDDSAVFAALVNAFHNDPSYAVEAAAAQQIGKSENVDAVDILKAAAKGNPDVHVKLAILDALAATGDPGAADVLLAEAQPGVSKRLRLRALTRLANMKTTDQLAHSQQLIAMTEAALHDSFVPIQEAGEDIVGNFSLAQFRSDIETEARSAPTMMQRDAASRVLQEMTLPQF
jgi:aminopeptidase N